MLVPQHLLVQSAIFVRSLCLSAFQNALSRISVNIEVPSHPSANMHKHVLIVAS